MSIDSSDVFEIRGTFSEIKTFKREGLLLFPFLHIKKYTFYYSCNSNTILLFHLIKTNIIFHYIPSSFTQLKSILKICVFNLYVNACTGLLNLTCQFCYGNIWTQSWAIFFPHKSFIWLTWFCYKATWSSGEKKFRYEEFAALRSALPIYHDKNIISYHFPIT